VSALEPSGVRRALDELLRRHPHLDLVAIDWQIDGTPMVGATERLGGAAAVVASWEHRGPWVLVDLGQPSDAFDETPVWAVHRFAIWKRTGHVYAIGADGAVADDPFTWSVVA
jgi:hypothetical protein